MFLAASLTLFPPLFKKKKKQNKNKKKNYSSLRKEDKGLVEPIRIEIKFLCSCSNVTVMIWKFWQQIRYRLTFRKDGFRSSRHGSVVNEPDQHP